MIPDPALEPALLRAGLIAPGQDWLPMHGGQTNKLWRVGSIVVKRYAPQDGNPRFPNDPSQEATMLHHLAGLGIAPTLIGQIGLNGINYLLYQHLDGAAWTQGPAHLGDLLRRVHEVPPPFGLRRLPGGSASVLDHVEAILPCLPAPMAAELRRKRPVEEVPPLSSGVLLHGDAVPGNILVTEDGLRLIDWQCPAVGDPAEDLAIFLSPAMQLIYRGSPLSPSEAEEFLRAYDDPMVTARVKAMQPWHHWAMAAYCAWKVVRGAQDYAKAMVLELQALQERD